MIKLNLKTDLPKIVEILKAGEVIVLQTDTIFGFACDGTNKEALQKIYEIKKIPCDKGIPYLVSNINEISKFTNFDQDRKTFVEQFWPGPITCVLRLLPNQCYAASFKETIGLRVPNNAALNELLNCVNLIATTSVNIHGEETINNPELIDKKFGNNIKYLVINETLKVNTPSQVYDLTSVPFRKLR